jgi:hypothetical protein|tara:strand:- start:2627 stop:3772 length:1146 start_codon:yes stop_codon:yes gene_type:complete
MKLNTLFFQFFSISNFFLNIFVVFLFLFFGYHDIAAQGFVIISITNIFTYGFSGNARNIYLGSKNITSIKKLISFRLIVSLFSILISVFAIYYFISKPNVFYLIGISMLTISSFIFELLIARTEKNNLLNKYHALNIILFFIITTILIYMGLLNYFIFYIFIYTFMNFIIFKGFFRNLFIKEIDYLAIIRANYKINIFSTLLKTISNLIWRYSALILLGNSKSATLFLAFSLGSFFGTIFDISYGALLLKKLKISINTTLNIFFLFYAFLIYLVITFFKNFSRMTNIESDFLHIATFYSLLGSYVMLHALQIRQKYFEISETQYICFKTDIIIYCFISLIIPILYWFNANLLVCAYLISSTFSYLMYRFGVQNDFKDKLNK